MAAFASVTGHMQDVTFLQIEGTNHMMGTGEDEHSGEVSSPYVRALTTWLTRHTNP